MNKKEFGIHLEGAPDAYKTYIAQRNGAFAQGLAHLTNAPYVGEVNSMTRDGYTVFATSQPMTSTERFGIIDENDFYGGLFENVNHTGKAILHPTVSPQVKPPSFYSHVFSRQVEHLVLPGRTVFSTNELYQAFTQLSTNRFAIRAKAPGESDGNGQHVLSTYSDVSRLLKLYPENLAQNGLVLEANVQHPKTISVGFMIFDKNTYSFIAHQKDAPRENGTTEYKGADITMVRGSMELLETLPLSTQEQAAIELSIAFYNAYSHFDPLASRLSFDVVEGVDNNGDSLIGVTDITARLGGTCPALIEGLKFLYANPDKHTAQAEVTLNYNPDTELYCETEATRYIDTDDLRVTARLKQ